MLKVATTKRYEIGIVPVVTKALKMLINNAHNTWEARQLFLLTKTLGKKVKWPARHCPGPVLQSRGQAVSDITQSSPRLGGALDGEGGLKPPRLGAADALWRLK